MLETAVANQLRDYLKMLKTPILLVPSPYSGDDAKTAQKSQQMTELLGEIAGMSDLVTLGEPRAHELEPSFLITRPTAEGDAAAVPQVRFAGLPLGHEFTSLVLALLQVGGHPVKEEQALLDAVKRVEGDFEFTTYMSLTCQNCPTVVQALNAMAVINPRIRHTAVEGGTFPQRVEELGIQSVPAIYLNGQEWGSGRMTVAEILERLDANAAASAREDLSERQPYDVLVIGAGPAGAAAGVYAARKGIRTAVVGERLGGQVLDTDAIENLISVPKTTGPKLGAALEAHMADYDIDVIGGQLASALHAANEDGLLSVDMTDGTLRAKSIVLATGARWRNLGVPGEDLYRNKGVTYCPHCDGPLFKGKRVAVVGGGNSGIEAAIDLAGVVEHVTVVEFMDSLKADQVLQNALRQLPNVDVVTGAAVTEVLGDGKRVTGLAYTDRSSGQGRQIDVAGVFVQIGLLPNTEWLQSGDLGGSAVELSSRGEIVVDDRGSTSMPGVFAAGDCTTVPFKQIIISMGAGATAALAAFDHLIRVAGSSDPA